MAVNTTAVAAGEALQVLRAGWDAQAAGNFTVSYMLHGRPGVGKTEIVRASRMNFESKGIPVRAVF